MYLISTFTFWLIQFVKLSQALRFFMFYYCVSTHPGFPRHPINKYYKPIDFANISNKTYKFI